MRDSLADLEEISRKQPKRITDRLQLTTQLLVGKVERRRPVAALVELEEIGAELEEGSLVGGHVGAELQEVVGEDIPLLLEILEVWRRVELEEVRAEDLEV